VPHRLLTLLAGSAAALALAGCGSSSSSISSHPAAAGGSQTTTAAASPTGSQTTTASRTGGPLSYEAVPLEVGPALGAASTTRTGRADGISCGPTEQLAYHVHAHLAAFVNGRPYALPAGIGIPGSITQQTTEGPVAAGGQCIYWLHTHSSDGVIHIESPTNRVYTLGNFFDVWHQPLTANQIAGVRGHVTAFLNGKVWTHSVRDLPLLPHGLVQLDIGQPAPPLMSINWSQTGL
jgi:hypothetical protein